MDLSALIDQLGSSIADFSSQPKVTTYQPPREVKTLEECFPAESEEASEEEGEAEAAEASAAEDAAAVASPPWKATAEETKTFLRGYIAPDESERMSVQHMLNVLPKPSCRRELWGGYAAEPSAKRPRVTDKSVFDVVPSSPRAVARRARAASSRATPQEEAQGEPDAEEEVDAEAAARLRKLQSLQARVHSTQATGLTEGMDQEERNAFWNDPGMLAQEVQHGGHLPWQDRGPPPASHGGPTTWRKQKWRHGQSKWGSSGGANRDFYKQYYRAYHDAQRRSATFNAAEWIRQWNHRMGTSARGSADLGKASGKGKK